MDRALEDSRAEYDRAERKRMDEEVLGTILEQSKEEEEHKQLSKAIEESKDMLYQGMDDLYYPAQGGVPAASSSSATEENRDSKEFQYPESVYAVMSMGFPLEKCIQAYHLVGDNPEGILAYCCQTLGR